MVRLTSAWSSRPLGGAGEDDVVHLLGAHRGGAWAPSTQPMASTALDIAGAVGPHHEQ